MCDENSITSSGQSKVQGPDWKFRRSTIFEPRSPVCGHMSPTPAAEPASRLKGSNQNIWADAS